MEHGDRIRTFAQCALAAAANSMRLPAHSSRTASDAKISPPSAAAAMRAAKMTVFAEQVAALFDRLARV